MLKSFHPKHPVERRISVFASTDVMGPNDDAADATNTSPEWRIVFRVAADYYHFVSAVHYFLIIIGHRTRSTDSSFMLTSEWCMVDRPLPNISEVQNGQTNYNMLFSVGNAIRNSIFSS